MGIIVGDSRFSQLRMRRLVLWPLAALIILAVIGFIHPRSNEGTMLAAAAYVLYAFLFVAALVACRSAGITPAEIVGSPPGDAQPWLMMALLAPLLITFSAMCLVVAIYVAARISPGLAMKQLAELDEPNLLEGLGTTVRILLVFNLVVVAPAVEEFVFRGMLLRRWVAVRGFWSGLLSSSAVFAVLHPHDLIGSFVFATVAGIVYLWSGSLLMPMVLHMFNNGVVAVAILADESSPTKPTTLAELQDNLAVPVLALLVIGVWIAWLVRPLVQEVRDQMRVAAPGSESLRS